MRIFPKQKWRLLLLVFGSFYFLPFGWWKDQARGLWAFVRHARVHDGAGVLTLNDQWHFERFLMHIYQESGVDVHFVFVPSVRGESLEEFSVRKARDLGVGREVDRRGLLFVYDVAAHDLRIEVGPQLEGVITDAFAGYLMRNHVRSFFGTGNPSLGLRTTMFMVHDRIRRAVLGQDFDPRHVQYIEDTRRLALGGGASADMRIAASAAFLNRERTSDRATRTRFAPQPTPEAAYQRYLEWDARGKYETDVPLFTPLSQEYLATLPMTPGFNDYYRAVEYGQPYKIMERGDLALLYFTADPLAGPLFFRRGPTGWMADIVAEVLDTRNYEGASWTWGLLATEDEFTRTFGDQYVVVGPVLRYNSDGDFAYGDRAKVYARAADSGYLVVLRADLNGRVRVLSPVDPDQDQHVSGGKKVELKGRGGREAFVAEDTSGQGVVLAAWSKTAFTFDRYVKDGRWDLDALLGEGARTDDPEAHLMAIADDMRAPGGHFDYDLAVYTVSAPHYARVLYPYPYGWPGWGGYNAWWGYGPPLVTTRIFVQPVRRFGIDGRFRR